jgi:hypothetical protein
VNVILIDPEDPEKGMKKCGNPVPKIEWPADPMWPIICDGCLRANQGAPGFFTRPA